MKRRILFGIPLWWLIVTLIVGLSAYAYQALTGRVEQTIQEPLSWVGDNTFTGMMYPKQTTTDTFAIANASPTDSFDVDIIWTITPDVSGKDIVVTVPNKVTISAVSQTSFDVTIAAGKSAVPGVYTVSFGVER